MPNPTAVAIAGVGRMGAVHALHLAELDALAAIVDTDLPRAHRVAAELRSNVPIFQSVDELANAGVCKFTLIATPTELHQQHAMTLIRAGHRVLLEKPLTGAFDSDREFAAELDRSYPDALMLAFQRRFDPPLQHAKQAIESGIIGRVFKIYSALEDSAPAPDGYSSPGILPDMSIHNVDEILWLTGKTPLRALAIGSRLYSHRLTTCIEDFDDAALYIWFEEVLAQIQVSRNHVSGYRVETLIFGDKGQIQIGHFDQKPFDIVVDIYGRRGTSEPLAHREFPMRRYAGHLPEFVDRFGPAYKSEVETFIESCRTGGHFPVTHLDGVRAQAVISAGMRACLGRENAAEIQSNTK